MQSTNASIYPPSGASHWLAALVLVVWFALTLVLSLNGVFVSEPGQPPLNILISMAISIGLFSVAYRMFISFRTYVLGVDMRLLIMLHSWRMLGLGFVMLYTQGSLPALFAYIAGFGDALTAVFAVVLAYTLFNRPSLVSNKTIWRWNTFGLVDFILAVSIGIMTRSAAPLADPSGITSDIMTVFPFAMIPGFLVQVFTLTHIIIYLQLRNGIRRG